MLLYTEKQLDEAYRIYCLHQIKQDISFMNRENFRSMYEKLMGQAYNDEEN